MDGLELGADGVRDYPVAGCIADEHIVRHSKFLPPAKGIPIIHADRAVGDEIWVFVGSRETNLS